MKQTIVLAVSVTLFAVASPSVKEQHEAGVAAHLDRSLNDAAAAYDDVLRRDPPRDPSAEEARTIERFAPRVFSTRSEPFALRDVAAILHPDTGVIAYHLFWDDDIDFPEDNDPSDHEVVWSVPSEDKKTLAGFHTYFHGRDLIAGPLALADARSHGGRPAVFVQWGKHGSMPIGWERLSIVAENGESESKYYPLDRPISLEEYNRGTWRKLTTEGRRERHNPIASRLGWPERFDGDWSDFSTFPIETDIVPMLRSRRAALVSRWNSATLNRWLIRYNFRPKTEWPERVPGAAR